MSKNLLPLLVAYSIGHSRFSGVVEAYEKAISELIAEKEQLGGLYEKKFSDLKNDSEQNAHHLSSLETTFSDLHA